MCGTDFITKRSYVERGGGRFCCFGCYRRSNEATSIEIKVRKLLTRMGLEYLAEYQVGPYVIDAFIPEYQIAVEADGSYWHGLDGVPEKDEARDAYLFALGIITVRFTEEDLNLRPVWCEAEIRAAVEAADRATWEHFDQAV